jgi:hypothetical protein
MNKTVFAVMRTSLRDRARLHSPGHLRAAKKIRNLRPLRPNRARMIGDILAQVLVDAVAGLFRLPWRPQRPPPPPDIRDAAFEATESERARFAAWAERRGLASEDGFVFTGSFDGLRVTLDTGCEGSSPRGPELEIRVSGLAEQPALITPSNPDDHPFGALFDDLTLLGSLRSIAVTSAGVRLRFAPGRSTGVLDVAMRELVRVVFAPPARPRSVAAHR